MTDIEIEKSVEKKDIREIASSIGISESDLILYGNDKAKIKKDYNNSNGKLILVTAVNPTPYGEGKTTVSIGLNDALNKLGKKSIAVLREPSLGPVFGMKGGATGGGYSQIIPSSDINLHFTGDLHAITSCNDLLSAAIDNHIYNGNSLQIDKVLFNRCLDVNDRSLRKIKINDVDYSFNITAASEIMSILCLSKNIKDLKNNLGNIIIGSRKDNSFVYAKDLKIEDSLTVLLKDAFYPNLVQSLENNPVLVHGGPFANISIGCNSVKATELGLSISDYVVTEAGFGADLGAEKFFDIKSRKLSKKVDCTVLVVTVRALKHYGSNDLKIGCNNLITHINNIKKSCSNVVVALNKFSDDIEQDITYIKEVCDKYNTPVEISSSYADGSNGTISLAEKVLEVLNKENEFKYLYTLEDSFEDKLNIVCREIYRANNIIYSEKALNKLNILKENKLSNLPICVAKTQYSITDDKNKLVITEPYDIHVEDINIYNGAGFITVLLGNILTMPGLPKNPNYENIKLDEDNNIIGIK